MALKNSGTHFNNQPREVVLSQHMVRNMRKILTFDFTVHHSRHCTRAGVLAMGWAGCSGSVMLLTSCIVQGNKKRLLSRIISSYLCKPWCLPYSMQSGWLTHTALLQSHIFSRACSRMGKVVLLCFIPIQSGSAADCAIRICFFKLKEIS